MQHLVVVVVQKGPNICDKKNTTTKKTSGESVCGGAAMFNINKIIVEIIIIYNPKVARMASGK